MANLDDLERQVEMTEQVEANAIATIRDLRAANTDPVRLQALIDRLNASATALQTEIDNPGV